MGARKKADSAKKADPAEKTGREKLSEVVAGLSEPDATTVSRVRAIASALDLEKVVDILDAGADIMSAVRALVRRDENRYTLSEAAEKAGLPVEQFAQLNLACGF